MVPPENAAIAVPTGAEIAVATVVGIAVAIADGDAVPVADAVDAVVGATVPVDADCPIRNSIPRGPRAIAAIRARPKPEPRMQSPRGSSPLRRRNRPASRAARQ